MLLSERGCIAGWKFVLPMITLFSILSVFFEVYCRLALVPMEIYFQRKRSSEEWLVSGIFEKLSSPAVLLVQAISSH